LKLICFDCDSTLSSIEGIDELARLRGPAVFAGIRAMTEDAMNGRIPLESVFSRRLEAIRPSRADAEAVGRRYIENAEPSAASAVAALRAMGWTSVIISGGFRQAIRPLAGLLGVGRIEAVDLYFAPDGSYSGYDESYPTTRSGGKPDVIRRLRAELGPERVVMVGDGVSDLETAPVVDLFIGFGGFTARERVRREASAFVTSLSEVPGLV
jgi:phosphoserine phosphatase